LKKLEQKLISQKDSKNTTTEKKFKNLMIKLSAKNNIYKENK
jgi:hypothetical protein